jgi:hypothetical protein
MPDIERSPFVTPRQENAPIQPEHHAEQERVDDGSRPASSTESVVVPPSVVPAQSSVPLPSDSRTAILKEIETLLSEGLFSFYTSLSEERRALFKQVGERTANTITDMIMYGKAKVKEIWKLVGDWLRGVPGVNKYFLEQEIKIKTDRIMIYAESVHP